MIIKHKMILILRWISRILGALIILLFVVFFIGESDFSKPPSLTKAEIVMMLFIPILLTTGIIIAWKKEILGGITIFASIIAFNIVSMISEKQFTFELDFGLFLILSFLFIICAILEKHL